MPPVAINLKSYKNRVVSRCILSNYWQIGLIKVNSCFDGADWATAGDGNSAAHQQSNSRLRLSLCVSLYMLCVWCSVSLAAADAIFSSLYSCCFTLHIDFIAARAARSHSAWVGGRLALLSAVYLMAPAWCAYVRSLFVSLVKSWWQKLKILSCSSLSRASSRGVLEVTTKYWSLMRPWNISWKKLQNKMSRAAVHLN